jgi:carnitine O-acetyltransferase
MHIKEDAKNFPNERPVGLLTAVHRDVWTGARRHLLSDDNNKAQMAIIESSAFAICLDDHTPASQMEAAQNLLLCDGNNRWFDKTLQLIVFENGRAGFIGEHSLIDATVVSRILTDAMANLTQPVEI